MVPGELRPPETEPELQATAAAGIVSFLVATGVRSTCKHRAPLTQVSDIFDLLKQWFPTGGGGVWL